MNDKQTRKNGQLKLLVETGDGRSSSAILENGFLQHCLDRDTTVHVLSPGACFRPFVDRYCLPGTQFTYLSVDKITTLRHRRLTALEIRLEHLLSRMGLQRAKEMMWRLFGGPLMAANASFLSDLIDSEKPDCFLTAHLNQGFGTGLLALCRKKGITTIANVFSWDHPFYPQQQRARPDKLTCWSSVVRDNLVTMGGFSPERIEVIGAPIFDPYFDPDGIWTRQQLCDYLELDPSRPILLFATLGQIRIFMDETGTFRAFLEAFDKADLPGPPQIILRLHPISVDHYFDEFHSRKDVVFSRYTRYFPGMRWCPSRDEVFLAGNLLRHADVCISPGSTMTVEAAIFDTPTIIPTFNPSMPEDYEHFFEANWLKKHFRFLMQEDTVVLAKSPEELIAAIRHALNNPSSHKEGRRKIREQLLGPLDGKSTERLADVTVKLAAAKNKR